MKFWAQIDENGICHTVSTTKTDVPATEENLGQVYRDGTFHEIEMTNAEKREKAYRELRFREDATPLILHGGEACTCDEAYAMIAIYAEEDKHAGTNKAGELGDLWAAAKDYIRELYPDEGGEDIEV